MTMLERFRTEIFLFFAGACLLALAPPEIRADGLTTIQSKVAQVLRRPGMRSTSWGIEIADTEKNVLLSVNPEKPFMPASVLKVLTTSAALDRLGPDFRFRTGVYADGEILADGTLRGDLYLVGRGDPNPTDTYGELLTRPATEELAEKVQAAGIHRITGQVIGDDSFFEHRSFGTGWTAQDLRNPYGAPISALSINNNVFWLYATPTSPKHLAAVWIDPKTSYFRIRNLATTGARGARRGISARLIPGTRTIVVSGVLPMGQSYSRHILVERPAEAAAAMLREELLRRGVAVGGGIDVLHSGELPKEARQRWKLLAERESLPLIRAVEIINKHSQNLHAEMLLRTLGAELRGRGSDEAGLEVVRDFIVSAGIDTRGIHLKDGCGLSRENLLTPHFQTSLLLALAGRPYFEMFLNTLAVSGTDGTLKRRLSAQAVRGSIYAKTGSLNGVSTLSGYMTTKSGRSLVFSIFANNAAASIKRVQRTIDEICSLFVNYY